MSEYEAMKQKDEKWHDIKDVGGIDKGSWVFMMERLELLDHKLKEGYHTTNDEHRIVVYSLLNTIAGVIHAGNDHDKEMFEAAKEAYNEEKEWTFEYNSVMPALRELAQKEIAAANPETKEEVADE